MTQQLFISAVTNLAQKFELIRGLWWESDQSIDPLLKPDG